MLATAEQQPLALFVDRHGVGIVLVWCSKRARLVLASCSTGKGCGSLWVSAGFACVCREAGMRHQ